MIGFTGIQGPTGAVGPTGVLSGGYGQLYYANSILATTAGVSYPVTFGYANPVSAGLTLNAATGEITLGSNGVYLVLFTGTVQINTTTTEVNIRLFANNSLVEGQTFAYCPWVSNTPPGSYPTIGFNYIFGGSAGDILMLKAVTTSSGKTIAFQAAQFSVVKIA
jgi:hypothetical protein